MIQVSRVWGGRAILGEGPVWDSFGAVLWFVDIKDRKVHRLDPATRATTRWDAPEQIGWILPARNGKLIAGLQSGLASFDPLDGSFETLCEIEAHLPTNRLNDATIAADGAIFFGSMDDGEAATTGRYYRWDGRTATPLAIDPVRITNGPALSPDQRSLYNVDTVEGVVYVADLDHAGRVVSNRVFARIDPADGYPDGCITDRAGNVWLGLWGGWRARLYSPDGDVLREVRLPVSNVTKIALGGPDLKTAFVTTACAGLDASELARQPDAGCIFSFEVDIPGIVTVGATS
ncbi:SMP-30/gluconolactonase/LRE family protein [Qipengyuania sp.]|uniref:SMP-30/gluconolactonase/LRE family protein n=1 Tax=Qipengyuania sp. TaxID=2004515 RepID=UPI003AF4B0EA